MKKKLTFNEIMRIVQKNCSVSEFAYDDFDRDQLGLGEIEEIEQYGGEDQGSTWYSIKHFVDHDVYVKTEGYYSSYHGTDFDEGYGYEVVPTKVEVIQYLAAPIVPDAEEDKVLTGEELIAKLETYISKSDFGDGYSTVDTDTFGENKIIERFGNHEGAGESAFTVRYFEKHDVYIKLTGFYSSYNGCNWNDYTVVRPAQKTITVFE